MAYTLFIGASSYSASIIPHRRENSSRKYCVLAPIDTELCEGPDVSEDVVPVKTEIHFYQAFFFALSFDALDVKIGSNIPFNAPYSKRAGKNHDHPVH